MTPQWIGKLVTLLLPKNQFAKNVLTLMTGTGLAQAIPIALSPILTRLYTPEDFGAFGLYISACAILVVFVTGKYEVAIVVAKRDNEALNLVAVTIVCSFLISALFLGVIFIFGDKLVSLIRHPEILIWLYFVPLTTWTLGCYHALNYWSNRSSRYKSMAASRVIQSSTSGVSQLVAGLVELGSLGLIWGQLAGQFIATLFLAKSLPPNDRRLFRRVSLRRMACVTRKHMDYPRYMMTGQAVSVSAVELPMLLLTIFFGVGIAGFYSLAQRVMAAPLSLVSNAIGDVYRQKAADQYARHGECKEFFLATFKQLLIFALLPLLPVLLFGPTLFAFFFGEAWRAAGEIGAILSILAFFQTASSPLSSTVIFAGWLHLDLIWQLSRLALTSIAFYFCHKLGASYQQTIAMHVGVFSSLYILHTFWQYKVARGLSGN